MLQGHGGNIYEAAIIAGCAPSEILDMSSNISPFPLPGEVMEELKERMGEIGSLPEVDSATLAKLLSDHHGLSKNKILVGSGATEFIYSIPERLRPPSVLILGPTYSDYADACQYSSIPERFLFSSKEDGFVPDMEKLRKLAGKVGLAFICNPNNPTGALFSKSELLDLIRFYPEVYFVVDESYLPFVEGGAGLSLLSPTLPDNLIVLRSFSKIYAIPGLRLGWLAASEKTAKVLKGKMQPWNVNRLAQIAGEILLRSPDNREQETAAAISAERERFLSGIPSDGAASLTTYPGRANFILIELNGPVKAPELCIEMLKKKILIRDCSNFQGLSDRFIRVSLKSRESNGRCLEALKDLLVTGH